MLNIFIAFKDGIKPAARLFFLLLIFFPFCYSNNSYSQNCEKKDPFGGFKLSSSKYGLIGSISYTEEFDYQQYVPDSMLISYMLLTKKHFDSTGRLRKETTNNGRRIFTYTYEYDSNSKNNHSLVTLYDSADKLISKTKYDYDYPKNAYTTTIIDTVDSEYYKDLYNYDSMGNLLIAKTIFPAEKVFVNKKYTYDKTGRPIKCTTYDSKGTVQQGYQTITYDAVKKMLLIKNYYSDKSYLYDEMTLFDNECRVIYRNFNGAETYIKYDNANNIVTEERRKNGQINMALSYKITYEYDNRGSWTSKTTYRLDDTRLTSVKRKIVYY